MKSGMIKDTKAMQDIIFQKKVINVFFTIIVNNYCEEISKRLFWLLNHLK